MSLLHIQCSISIPTCVPPCSLQEVFEVLYLISLYFHCHGVSRRSSSGCAYTVGIKPMPVALRIAFANLRWLTGRSPVSARFFNRPIDDINSPSITGFCTNALFR